MVCKEGLFQRILGNGHKWEYFKRIHYKYRGPVMEFFKHCTKCGKVVEITPWSHEKVIWENRSRMIDCKSSF